MAGTRLGPYKIAGLIGSGGMGEVYRARDSRLERDVAIKVLPERLRDSPERLRRFEQEARAAGGLNHPNVLGVLDVGTEGGIPYVVSELLEGSTLRQRLLSGGALSPQKAVECAIQVALGLAAAHEKGIVHRDLKPENLFLTKDRRVKILDFGLAKLCEPVTVDSPGETGSHDTEPGTVLGTVGYMSPEQVRGWPADHRSDIFSFGAVLYEMLARRRAFTGDSAPEVLTAILKQDPPELGSGDGNLSPALGRIVRRCLEKRPDDRFHDARDVAFALEAVSTPSAAAVEANRRRVGWRRAAAALLGAALLVSSIAIPAGFLSPRPRPASFTRLTFRRGTVTSARLTADGNTVAYSASWEGGGPVQVYSKRIHGRESARLDLPAADVLAISATGELALKRRDADKLGPPNPPGTLARVPLTGTAVRDVLEGVIAADWSPDGRALAVVRKAGARTRVEFPIGTVLLETDDSISALRVSPAGDRLALASAEEGSGARIQVMDLAGRRTTLSEGWRSFVANVAWAPSGREVWFTALQAGWIASLRAVTLSGKEREILQLPGRLRLLDISSDGRVLMSLVTLRGEMYGRAPGQTQERDLSWYESSSPLGLSADGSKLLFAEVAAATVDPVPPLYLRGTDGSPAVPIGSGWPAALSDDARWVAACAELQPTPRMKVIPTGVGEERNVDLGSVACRDLGWFPDGRRVLLTGAEPGRRARSYVVDPAAGTPRPLTPEGTICTAASPDGMEAACLDPDGRVFFQAVAGGEPRPVIGLEPGETVREWSADGRSLIVGRWETWPLRVFIVDRATGRRSLWREFQPADPTGVFDMVSLVATRDLRGYVYRYRRHLSELYLVDGLR